jgi:phosphate transport system substrate-binding protein
MGGHLISDSGDLSVSIIQNTLLRSLILGAAAVAMAPAAPAAVAADITGAGSSFAAPLLAKWAEAYKAKTGNGLNYQSIGSGAGIKLIKSKTVTFGASDKPLKQDELDASGLTQFPMMIGGVVPVVNLKGVSAGQLVLDGPTIANIYLGKITAWNDAAIQKLNPSVKLPATAIAVTHRSDGSGTSFLFTTYLAAVSPEWADKVGASTAVEWPVGVGGKGNEGVSAVTQQTDGAIGYVEYAYAKTNNMAYTKMVNHDGKVVAPTMEAFQAAAASADWAHAPAFYLILDNQPGAASWPIEGASFAIIYKKPENASDLTEALKFFDWSYKNGQKMADSLDYIMMPPSVVALIQKNWVESVKDGAGQSLWK